MLAAISYILLAFGMLEDAYARGYKPDWPKTLTLAALIIVYSAIGCAALIWGVSEKRTLLGLGGFAVTQVIGFTICMIVARHWMVRGKAQADQNVTDQTAR